MEPYSIADFMHCREACFFCGAKLKSRLSNFVGVKDDGMPLLNSPIKDGKISFRICHTTSSFSVEAGGDIDIRTNAFVLTLKGQNTDTPAIDSMLAKQAFTELLPHIQLYCPKKDCPYSYTVASNLFTVGKIEKGDWMINDCKLYYESFVLGNLWIQNDYLSNKLYIYSIDKPETYPLIFPVMDLSKMGKTKVINRVKTLVIFS